MSQTSNLIKGPWPALHSGIKQWHKDKRELTQRIDDLERHIDELNNAASVLLVEATHFGSGSSMMLDEVAAVLQRWEEYEPGTIRIYGSAVDRLRFARARVYCPILLEAAVVAVGELPDDSEARGMLLEAIDRAIPNDVDADSRTPVDWIRAPEPRHKRKR